MSQPDHGRIQLVFPDGHASIFIDKCVTVPAAKRIFELIQSVLDEDADRMAAIHKDRRERQEHDNPLAVILGGGDVSGFN